ncbi:putative cobaltochelatase [Pseudoduganella plicata]|uniref:Mg-protoporphyrin IX chelatase n=1 Tax=Pseudoduganella plicata TaxID=321984 RepID=A0A4P7BA62_9BURK|nr:putative cobaltochelatase [Pseudoduganella plicata]QBQ34970.1 putative cobaltochelatase [Pseudoduganella plicata]GGZ06384.1 magnesium chelatase [Pseudoduganella plicata]
MSTIFPFSAIVGQAQLRTALMLCAVDPSIGGVLIRGDKGTAKSTAARALAAVLPPVARVPGCAFNCAPDHRAEPCDICRDGTPQASDVPFVTLPLGATEDRVLGSLDIASALQGGARAFQPGLLASAHRGLLYIDEVNLLADHLVDVLLDVAAMGVNSVQREGLSISHPARFTLVGTMNLEEGDLRPQLLDRFGLMVEVAAPRDKAERAEVVRRRIGFEADPAGFAAKWHDEQEALRARLAAAQRLLPDVRLDDAMLDLISHLCCEFDVASLRADIVLHKTSRALAALDGRQEVTPADLRTAAQLVLPHRRRRKPFEQPGLDQDRLDDLLRQAAQPPQRAEGGDGDAQDENDGDAGAGHEEEQVFAAAASGQAPRIDVAAGAAYGAAGRRSAAAQAPRGQAVRAVPDEQPTSIAIGATLRSAALRGGDLRVTRADLHQQVRAGTSANLILFVVDASGSMAAQSRMAALKGAVLDLLTDAYQRRDHVAVVAFRGQGAELLLAPTRSVDLAEQGLRELPTGGRTPLPHALQLVLETLQRTDAAALPPLLVLLTDGRANVALAEGGDPWREALALAEQLAARRVPALVIDTENGYLRLGRAAQLATALGADCLTLEELSADSLALTVRTRLAGA